MSYQQEGKERKKHIVNNEEILIGRNDEEGYYFKFGIYRVGNSTIPVAYNLAGYEECEKLREIGALNDSRIRRLNKTFATFCQLPNFFVLLPVQIIEVEVIPIIQL